MHGHQQSVFDIHCKGESFLPGSKQFLISSIHSLLSVQPFSFSKILEFFIISLGYQSSFHLLFFKITNSDDWWLVVTIASIKVSPSRFPTWFINVRFWYFKNTTLELPAIPIIYLLSSILYVFLSSILCLTFVNQYMLNFCCIKSRFLAKNRFWSRAQLYFDCNIRWQVRNLAV